jgi:hypothetical protein
MKLLYYVPAIGKNNLEKKHGFLLNNLRYIYDTIKQPFSVAINFYTVSEEIKSSVKALDFVEETYFYERPGVLTELFLTNPYGEKFATYDYILFVLDDVSLINVDIPDMIRIKEKYDIELLSPSILKSTHRFMNPAKDITIHNFLEVYVLLMRPVDYERFCSIHTIENKWMWGVDFLFGYYKIKAGVVHKYVARHELPSRSNGSEAGYLMTQYLHQRTPFKNFNELKAAFPPVYNTIYEE